jgi:HSP20 family protein
MAVFRWGHSWDAFDDLEREVDRLLKSVSLTFHGLRVGRQYPPVNLYEFETEYLLTAELPGTHPDDLELTIADGVLTLKGSRAGSADVPAERFRRQERASGEWHRSLTLPERVRADDLSAELNNGVLQVHLPKTAETSSRQIPVVGGE